MLELILGMFIGFVATIAMEAALVYVILIKDKKEKK